METSSIGPAIGQVASASTPETAKVSPKISLKASNEDATNATSVKEIAESAANVREQTTETVARLNKDFEKLNVNNTLPNFGVEIALSQDSSETIISLVDKETGDVIRQIPPEEAVEVKERLQEITEKFDQLKGVLFKNQV